MRFGTLLTPIIDPPRVGPGLCRSDFAGFGLRPGGLRRSCAEIGQDCVVPPRNSGAASPWFCGSRAWSRGSGSRPLFSCACWCFAAGEVGLILSPYLSRREKKIRKNPSWVSFHLTIQRRWVPADYACRLMLPGLLGECGRSVMC